MCRTEAQLAGLKQRLSIQGEKFGRLTVIGFAYVNKYGCSVWKCRCDCGTELEAIGYKLRNGHTTSCGCSRKHHGKSGTKLHNVWANMKYRCNNENMPYYKDYGGRGIKVCDEWQNSFQAFYDYVSKLPHFGEEGYSLDRINNDGNYEPNNVRWATQKEQNTNRRRAVTPNDSV